MRPLKIAPEDRPLASPAGKSKADVRAEAKPEARTPLAARIEPRIFSPGSSYGTEAAPTRDVRRRPQPRWVRHAIQVVFLVLFAMPFSALGWWMQKSGLVDSILEEGDITMAQIANAAHLNVEEVSVGGRVGTPIAALLDAVGVKRGDPILDVDIEAVRKRVEALGWVKSAAVWRKLPGTIHIDIEEREPAARWQIDGRMILVDRSGHALEEGDPDDFRYLVRIVGADAAKNADGLLALIGREASLKERVVNAVRVRGRRWDIEFDNGLVARLPEEDPESAWSRLAQLEREHSIFRRDIAVIDLRLLDRVVVKLGPDVQMPKRGGKST